MKNLILAILIIFSVQLTAQNELQNKKKVFVRVYDLVGKKSGKGKLLSIDAHSMLVKDGKKSISIEVAGIGKIKTKHAFGHNVGVGAITGATVGIIGGFAVNPDGYFNYSRIENAAGFSMLGIVLGSAIGGFTALFKKSQTFEINGDIEKWKALVDNNVLN